jgi:hypothetical protein
MKRALKTITLTIVVMLSGCETCRNHPVACSVAVTLVAGSLVAEAKAKADRPSHDVGIGDPYCYGNPRMCE